MRSQKSGTYLIIFCSCFSFLSNAQKQVADQSLFWLGSVNDIRFNEHWGLNADFHFRSFDFMSHPYNYILRGRADYYFNERLSAGLGYGHMWTSTFTVPRSPFSNEHRLTQQVQLNSKKGRLAISNRWRLEQRWRQKIVNNERTADYRFTVRPRYAISFIYSPFKNPVLPSFTNYNEFMIQFGKEVVYNTFDQLRLSLGIRQIVSAQLNVDLNYMYIYQQQAGGNQYVSAHTLRLFINYSGGLKKNNHLRQEPVAPGEE
jgi:hypothetical protein